MIIWCAADHRGSLTSHTGHVGSQDGERRVVIVHCSTILDPVKAPLKSQLAQLLAQPIQVALIQPIADRRAVTLSLDHAGVAQYLKML
jgi:hypothetical protein